MDLYNCRFIFSRRESCYDCKFSLRNVIILHTCVHFVTNCFPFLSPFCLFLLGQQKDTEANQNAVSVLDAALCAQKEEAERSHVADERRAQQQVAVLTLAHQKTLRQRQVLSRGWQRLALHSKTARVAMGYDGLRSIEQRRKRRWMHRRVVVLALRSALGRTFQKWLAMCTRKRRHFDGVQKWALLASRKEQQALAHRWSQWQRVCAREAVLDAEAIRAGSVRVTRAFWEWRLHSAQEVEARKAALQSAHARTSNAFAKWRLMCAQESAIEAEDAHAASARRVCVRAVFSLHSLSPF